MSVASDNAKISQLAAEVWVLPRQKMDTATILDVYPNLFSATVLCLVFGCLMEFIGFFAGAAGESPAAKSVGPPAYVLGTISLIAALTLFSRIRSGRKQYQDEQDFAHHVFDHVLAQPSAPNRHLFERVALPQTLGGDETLGAVGALHAWRDALQAELTEAVIRAAGLEPGALPGTRSPATVQEVIPRNLTGRLGEPLTATPMELNLDQAGHATVWQVTAPVTYRVAGLERALGELNAIGDQLASANVPAVLHGVVTRNPAGDWYLLDASVELHDRP